jgi:hypothetical protein
MAIVRQVFRQTVPPVLLMRPGEQPAMVLLAVPPADLAAAAASCAQRRFPVDAAIGLALESVTSARQDEALASGSMAHWTEQLEAGVGWFDDQLPWVHVPARLVEPARDAAVARRSVELVYDRARLDELLYAELRASRYVVRRTRGAAPRPSAHASAR